VRALRSRLLASLDDDRGSSPVEFLLVGTMLTLLTLGVLQLGLSIYVRNVVHDAAVEGAFHAALADTSLHDGARRTGEIISRTVGAEYASEIDVHEKQTAGHATIEVTVQTTLPLLGLLGAPGSMEVSAHAPDEFFD
jgi:Flp pilus assembly protein TadG